MGHSRRGRRDARPAARQGARRLPLHGRRLRREKLPGRLHLHRDRARGPDRRRRALRADSARGEPRQRQPQLHDPTPRRGRALGRHADGALGRIHQRDRLGRILGPDLRADGDALRLRERAHADLRSKAEHAPECRLSRPRLRRGNVRPRVRPRRAGRKARSRPARRARSGTAAAGPRRTLGSASARTAAPPS